MHHLVLPNDHQGAVMRRNEGAPTLRNEGAPTLRNEGALTRRNEVALTLRNEAAPMSRRALLAAGVSLPIAARAASIVPPAIPGLRQISGRPLWQPVTNRNSTNGTQGTPSTSFPATLTRVTKTAMIGCSSLRTVLMAFQMNPYEQPVVGNFSGVTGAYACLSASASTPGSGYTVGDVLLFSKGAADMTALVLIITRLGTSGAVAELKVADPGAYAAPLADAIAPASVIKRGGTASAGTGALFSFTWQEYGLAAQLGVEPAGTQIGTNANAVIPVGIGLHYDGLAPNTTLLIPDGGFVITDPIRLSLAKGAPYAERIATIGAPPGVQRTTMGVDYFSSANTWRAGALTSTTLAPGTGAASMDTITLGLPTQPAPWVCIIGDSIDYGIVGGAGTTVDSGDSLQNSGWVERGLQLAGGFGLLSITRTGDSLGDWYLTQNRRFMRLGMLGQLAPVVNFGSCVFVVSLCINDVTASTTSANIIAMIQWLCQDLLAFNPAGLFYSTAMPGGVNSTDSYATVGNQSVSSVYDTNRKAVNTWIRTGGGGLFSGLTGRTLTGIIDRAAVVEVQNGPSGGVWQPNYTNDGTHPTQAVHANVLAPLIQSVFSGFTLPS